MKKSIIYSLTAFLLIASSCRKNDNPNLPALTQVPMPLLVLDPTSVTALPSTNQDAFTAKFTVDNYFKDGALPSKFDVVIEKNGDPTNVKVLVPNVTTFPTSVTLTGLQLRTLFNAPIAGGDKYTVGVDVYTQDGTKYPAFLPAGANTYSPLDAKLPNSRVSIDFNAPAKFVVSAYGAFGVPTPYKVLQDDWADYNVGDIIPVTVIDATHISFKYATSPALPIVITVDPITNVTSVPTQNFGGYPSAASYGTFTATSVPDVVNAVFPANLIIGVKLDLVSTTKGDQGNFIIKLQKK